MANIYPPLEERRPAPALLVPAFYLLFAFAALFNSRLGRLSILALLITLAASSPYFVAKTLNEDYSRGLPSFAIPIFFADLLLFSRAEGVRLMRHSESNSDHNVGISDDDCDTLWKKFKWGFRLVASFRLIGWNVQVKGVPHNHDKDFSRRDFVLKYLMLSGISWAYKLVFHYLIGVAIAGRAITASPTSHYLCDILEGWSGALVRIPVGKRLTRATWWPRGVSYRSS